MAVSDEQIAFIHDLFSSVGLISTRKMFGGLGIYADGVIFALLLSDGSLRLKGTGDMAKAYEADGWERWTYTRKTGKTAAMPYWLMPDHLLDDPDAASDWAKRALSRL